MAAWWARVRAADRKRVAAVLAAAEVQDRREAWEARHW